MGRSEGQVLDPQYLILDLLSRIMPRHTAKSQRVKESKRQKVKEIKSRRVKKSKSQKVKESKRIGFIVTLKLRAPSWVDTGSGNVKNEERLGGTREKS